LGNAYCYEYELLVQLLSDPQLVPFLDEHRDALTRAFRALDRTQIPIGENEFGWASGHLNPSISQPESWTTASVYHFCHLFRQVVVSMIRKELFAYARAPMPRLPSDQSSAPKIDQDAFLDCRVIDEHGMTLKDGTGEIGLRRLLEERFLAPICAQEHRVRRGHRLSPETPNSAILYGPPGTSKTQLAEVVAGTLAWPLLKLDPSHLTRDGFDRLHAETNLLFTMLASVERVVVLLDEFDELVQDRDQSGAESSSRFLTTAMLPKIAELASRRRIVYLLATNHIERFDDAISRAGRFDLVVPVMPPTLDEKLRKWKSVAQQIGQWFPENDGGLEKDLAEILEDLTYLEFRQFVQEINSAQNRSQFSEVVRNAGNSATLRKPIGDTDSGAPVTWKTRVLAEARRNRLRHA
jgi:hypothetical protein